MEEPFCLYDNEWPLRLCAVSADFCGFLTDHSIPSMYFACFSAYFWPEFLAFRWPKACDMWWGNKRAAGQFMAMDTINCGRAIDLLLPFCCCVC